MGYSFKEIIRGCVLFTNKIWPFFYLNRLVYGIAIWCFLAKIKKFPQIKSVYLRPAMSADDWVPGISDIDITVVIDGDPDDREELVFLRSFWGEYRHLQRIFPMLGEAELLDQRSLDIWSRFGVRGYEFRSWKLLSGRKVKTLHYEVSPLSLQKSYLNSAFSFFIYNFRESYKNNTHLLWALRRKAKKGNEIFKRQ